MTLLVILLWGCATHSITGTIQTIDQTPLSNASCTFFDQQVQSNEDGRFEINNLNLKKGEYPIQCTHKGFQFYQQSFFVEGTNVTLPPIVLDPLEVQIPYLRLNMDPESELLPNEPGR